MNQFSVEEQYQAYLMRVNLKEEKMMPVQRIESRRTFFGAWGQAMLCLRDDVSELSDDDAYEALESMILQVANYWQKESDRYKAKNQ